MVSQSVEPGDSCSILHVYHLRCIHDLLTPYFFKFILINPGTGKNRECKCEHICLAALKFRMRKEFVQVELGKKVKLGQNFARSLLKKRVLLSKYKICLQLPVCFSELRFFLPNFCSKHFTLLMKIQYLTKEKFINLVLLLDHLQNYMVVSFPSYRVTGLLLTNYFIVKYGL